MKRLVLVVAVSIACALFSSPEGEAMTTTYQWTQSTVWSVGDNGIAMNLPITSSGSICVSAPYLLTSPDGSWQQYWANVYSFQFTFTDALGTLYSWDISGVRVLDLEFYPGEGFGLDFHLQPMNEVALLVSWPIHAGYSYVGDSGVPNIYKGTPAYHAGWQGINFEGEWKPVQVPEPDTFLLVGSGLAWLAAARRMFRRSR